MSDKPDVAALIARLRDYAGHAQPYDLMRDAAAALQSQAERVAELERNEAAAFTMLAMLGVPKERARSVHNGIDVLSTRWRKADAAAEARVAELEAQIVKIKAGAGGEYSDIISDGGMDLRNAAIAARKA